MKCVQNAITVILGAKTSVARQPIKCCYIYTPNMSNLVAMSNMSVGNISIYIKYILFRLS